MTQINAKVIADSKNEFGNRITTMILTFPRYILAEFNTHRMFSRNSASSRAIPFAKMVESVENNPFIPVAWQKDHKGMQGTEYFNKFEVVVDKRHEAPEFRNMPFEAIPSHWKSAIRNAIKEATHLHNIGVTKQLCNRLLEPFMWHTVIVTATEWENFFALRCPQYKYGENTYRSRKDCVIAENLGGKGGLSLESSYLEWVNFNEGQAEIHMMALAEAMWNAMNESTPQELQAGEWHIPFEDRITDEGIWDFIKHEDEIEIIKSKIATAMCARVSYTVVGEEGKEPNYENDIKLHDRLAESGHWSPFEHCAQAMREGDFDYDTTTPFGWSGNFKGFIQYRKTFQNENITKQH